MATRPRFYMPRKHRLLTQGKMENRIPNYYFIGQLEAETTADIPTQHRFCVNGVVYHKYSKSVRLMLAYIDQSSKSERWKEAARRYVHKTYNLDDKSMRLLALFDLI